MIGSYGKLFLGLCILLSLSAHAARGQQGREFGDISNQSITSDSLRYYFDPCNDINDYPRQQMADASTDEGKVYSIALSYAEDTLYHLNNLKKWREEKFSDYSTTTYEKRAGGMFSGPAWYAHTDTVTAGEQHHNEWVAQMGVEDSWYVRRDRQKVAANEILKRMGQREISNSLWQWFSGDLNDNFYVFALNYLITHRNKPMGTAYCRSSLGNHIK